MSAPVKASSIKVTAADLGKTDEQIRQERVTAAVKGRRARAEALRQVGALTGAGSPDLATSLEARLKARLDAGAKSFKAKQAVDAMRKRKEAAWTTRRRPA